MPLDKHDDRSYMDGVPVKISEKYKRRLVIRLPVSCQNCNVGPAFHEKYDFRLEKATLAKMVEWKKFKEENSKINEEKISSFKAFEEENIKNNKKVEKEANPKPELDAKGAHCIEPHILMPINVNYDYDDKQITKPIPSKFNVSDFETDNSSPFDNMELKTINDMEILASVLSSSCDTRATSAVAKPSSSSPTNNNIIPNENGVVWNNWDGYQMYSSPQYYEPSLHYSNMYQNPGYNYQFHQTQIPWHGGGSTPVQNYGPHVVKENHLKYSVSNAEKTSYASGVQPQKSNSKSVPDLVLELENELKEKKRWDEHRRKTQTPPPRPIITSSSGLEDWKPWPDIESPRHTGPDALESLDISLQVLAKSISEMGFPIERVVRTIRKFQRDDKKVIEFLLQVQRFEEKKFKGDIVEKALHVNNYDENETLKHLEAATVLLDLGFDPNKIQTVLLDCKNDRDAALERLIT